MLSGKPSAAKGRPVNVRHGDLAGVRILHQDLDPTEMTQHLRPTGADQLPPTRRGHMATRNFDSGSAT
jgi:hypothetical protein